MIADTGLADRARKVQDRISNTCKRIGRNPDDIRVVVVTKTFPVDSVRKACALPFSQIGENRVQECVEKYSDGWLRREFPDVQLHLIGHLQSNKVRKTVQLFDAIDSVDSLKLAQIISRIAAEEQKSPRILLEVNTSGESQKYGLNPDDTIEIALNINQLQDIRLAGLMTVGPLVEDSGRIRASFRLLRELFEQIHNRMNSETWSVLSMGMSGDFELAVEEGATELRLGSILMGTRRSR